MIYRSAVPARSGKGERLLLYLGIIDILQSYRLKKKLEHTFKSMIADGVSSRASFSFFLYILSQTLLFDLFFRQQRQISVCHPKFYSNRFIEFMTQKVFRKASMSICCC